MQTIKGVSHSPRIQSSTTDRHPIPFHTGFGEGEAYQSQLRTDQGNGHGPTHKRFTPRAARVSHEDHRTLLVFLLSSSLGSQRGGVLKMCMYAGDRVLAAMQPSLWAQLHQPLASLLQREVALVGTYISRLLEGRDRLSLLRTESVSPVYCLTEYIV